MIYSVQAILFSLGLGKPMGCGFMPSPNDDYIYFVVKKDPACISRDSRDTNKQNWKRLRTISNKMT